MKKFLAGLLLLTAMMLLGFSKEVRAASLFGKVIEVNDGDLITIFNLNRPVKVRLLGIDAPEPGQPFAEVARQHLKDLVADRLVTVEYSGLGQNNSVVGRVTLDGVDICAQMIRDGAAWFDVNNNNRLAENDRQIYVQSELAARNEKRGLWQTTDPTAPWDFVKGNLRRNLTATSSKSVTRRTSSGSGQLSSESLMGSALARGSSTGSLANLASNAPRNWRQFQPAGGNFSVIVPNDGFQTVQSVPFRDKPIDFNFYIARDGASMYTIVWATGPFLGETDETAMSVALAGLLKGMGQGYDSVGDGHKFKCDVKSKRNVAQNGYSGQEFDLTGCTVPGLARVYTKVNKDQRQMIVGLTFFVQSDPSTRRFLQSFQLGQIDN